VPGIRPVILLLVILLSGAHSAGTQVVAWTSMTVERAQSMPMLVALQTVFAGVAPCRICRAAEQLQGADVPAAPQPTSWHLDLAPAEQVGWILPQPAIIARLSPCLLYTSDAADDM
jgi:hypothetical protein